MSNFFHNMLPHPPACVNLVFVICDKNPRRENPSGTLSDQGVGLFGLIAGYRVVIALPAYLLERCISFMIHIMSFASIDPSSFALA